MKFTALLFALLLLPMAFAFGDSLDVSSFDNSTEVVVRFVEGFDINELSSSSSGSTFGASSTHGRAAVVSEDRIRKRAKNFNAVAGSFTSEELQVMVDAGVVEHVYENKRVSISLDDAIPNTNTTFFRNLDFNGAGIDGSGKTVCVIDTGIDYNHSDLAGAYLGGYDFVNDDANPFDDNGHGTHVAGIIASRNETYQGVAPGVGLYVVKALDSVGGGSFLDVEDALIECYNEADTYNITVVSMSLGTNETAYDDADDCEFSTSGTLIDLLVGRNISVVIASGNEGFSDGIAFPACIPSATAVGAVNDADSSAGFTNVGDLLDLFAPGVSIVSTATTGDGNRDSCDSETSFASCSGTSMATPMVAGAFALMQQFLDEFRNETITPNNLTAIFNDTGVPVTDSGETQGRIDIWSAYYSLVATPPQIAFESPTLLDGGFTNETVTVNVSISDIHTIDHCYVRYNETNYIMSNTGGTNATCTLQLNLTHGERSYQVYAMDSQGEFNYTLDRDVVINNVVLITPVENVINVSENVTLDVNYTATDADGDSLSYYWYMNGTLESTDANFSQLLNFTSEGVWNLTVIIDDNFQNVSNQWTLNISDLNRLNVNSSITSSVFTNDTIYCNVSASDPDVGGSYTTQLNWYFSDVLNASLENVTFIGNTNTSKHENFTCEVIVVDNLGLTVQRNLTVSVANSLPVFTLTNFSINASEIAFLSINATDLDGDLLSYSIDDPSFSQIGNNFTWNTTGDDGGTYVLTVNVSDGENVTSKELTLFVEAPSHNVTGNASTLNSTNMITVRIGDETNLSQNFTGVKLVNLTDVLNNPLMTFMWNFTNASLSLNFTIEYSSSTKSLYVHNLNLPVGVTKALYLPTSGVSYICIIDNATALPGDVSSSCTSSGEVKITCPATVGNYTCSTEGSYYKITNLTNTVVKGKATSSGGSSGGGGGGGGGGGSSTAAACADNLDNDGDGLIDLDDADCLSSADNDESSPPTCREDWICDVWSACNDGQQTRVCFDGNSCGTEDELPPFTLACTEPVVEEVIEEVVEPTVVEIINETVIEEFGSSTTSDGVNYNLRLIAAMIVLVAAIMLTTTSKKML